MADWIKVEITSSQKIEVLTIADILDIDEHMVFGKLVILWCWADANTVDGHADNVTKRMIDRVVGHKGFADAMIDDRVGWLKEDGKSGVFFPNFDRHNGKGAKKRATDARRKSSHRAGVANKSDECHNANVTDTVTREDKIREDKIREDHKDTVAPKVAVDFSLIKMGDEELTELKRIRRKNKGGAITQRVANALAKEFDLARSNGLSNDDILTEWEVRGWKSFKAEWVKSTFSKPNKHDLSNTTYTSGKF